MADQNVNPVGCLGRVLTTIGVAWFALVVLGALGVLSEVGFGEGFVAGAIGSVIPAVLLIAAGRALRRRARTIEERATPVPAPVSSSPSQKRVPTIRTDPPPEVITPPVLPSTPSAPSPAVKPAAKPAPAPEQPTPADTNLPPPLTPPSPKTSRQLIDEARKRWGRPRT